MLTMHARASAAAPGGEAVEDRRHVCGAHVAAGGVRDAQALPRLVQLARDQAAVEALGDQQVFQLAYVGDVQRRHELRIRYDLLHASTPNKNAGEHGRDSLMALTQEAAADKLTQVYGRLHSMRVLRTQLAAHLAALRRGYYRQLLQLHALAVCLRGPVARSPRLSQHTAQVGDKSN